MLKQQVYSINNLLMAIDGLCIISGGYIAFILKYYAGWGLWDMAPEVFTVSLLSVVIINNYMMGKFGLYGDRRPAYIEMGWSVFKAMVVTFGALSIGIFLFQNQAYSRLFFILFAAISFGLILVFRILFLVYLEKIARRNPYSRKILLVGSPDRVQYVRSLLTGQVSWGHEIIGNFNICKPGDSRCGNIDSCNELEKFIRENTVDEIIFALNEDQSSICLSEYLNLCKKTGLYCRILPAMWNPSDDNLSIESCQGIPFLTLRSGRFNATGMIYKRVLDIVGGLSGTLIFLILYPVVAAAIKIDSPGPVIFMQKRVGKHGRTFHLFKFRTMYLNAEERLKELMAANEMNGGMFKMKDDPRITRVGKWLRKTSLDEIPQFLNVLKGEMSLVGTRPPTPSEVKNYATGHLRRIAIKPGITGMWQVSGRNQIKDFDKVVELDWQYIENWRFSLDLKILLKTVWVVLLRKGAI